MSDTETVKSLIESGVSRRAFARTAIAGGLLAGVAAAVGLPAEVAADSLTDEDILNFALNLEYLEAEFYSVASSGKRLSELGVELGGVGQPGPTVGGAAVSFDARYATIAAQITLDEVEHVQLLRGALGDKAVAKPAINLEALGLGFGSYTEFAILARAFEDTGVSAYGGAAPLIKSSQVLATAARIGLTEAQHAGVLRLVAFDLNLPQPMVDANDVPPLGSPAGRLFQVDGTGLSTVRTTSQVLAIVYGNNASGTRAGAFFPNGLNGRISVV